MCFGEPKPRKTSSATGTGTISRPRNRLGFEIAIICALVREANAVLAIFDQIWDEDHGQRRGDHNAYTTGAIGGHNVVLVHMPGMGRTDAHSTAVSLPVSFPGIKLALVVGVCGGVPYDWQHRRNIYLGDVIISSSLVRYDSAGDAPPMSKRNGQREDQAQLGRYHETSAKVQGLLAQLEGPSSERIRNNMNIFLAALQQKSRLAAYPGVETDRLSKPTFIHQHRDRKSCRTCGRGKDGLDTCAEARQTSCHALLCERHQISRLEREAQSQNVSRSRIPTQNRNPAIHVGKIGCGNRVIKCGQHRDVIANRHGGLIGIEMEGHGVEFGGLERGSSSFVTVVIKGVCDYADSHKNKMWQDYAAASAAAGVKAF